MSSEPIWFAIGLSTFAGLSTGIGSVLGVLGRHTDKRVLTLAMGFSAGVMVYVSFVELLPVASAALEQSVGQSGGGWAALAAFFGGMALIGLIDRCVPSPENPHEFPDNGDDAGPHPAGANALPPASPNATDTPAYSVRRRLMRLGVLTTFALAIHNFPEGIATLLGGLREAEVGIPIAVAVAIHNVPEGIAVAVPIYQATGNRRLAFTYSFLSGLAEPVGAIAGYAVLMPFLNDTLFGVLFAGTAGIMVFISFDQLLPAAERYGQHHASIYGVVGGMAVMAVSLLLL